jgi:DNA-binding response OmpR family regulator
MRILLVEDEERIAGFVQRGLVESGYSVEWAATGSNGMEAVQQIDFDLIILDLMLPDADGLELLEKIRARSISPPILILSAKGRLEDRVRGLELGADDYLTKPFAFAELLARVRALLRRGSALPDRLNAADLTLDCIRRKVTRKGQTIDLAPKEFSILEMLLRNQGRPLTRTAIVEHVWDAEYDGLTNIVDVYIRHLRAKIDEGADLKLIRTVRGVGYMLDTTSGIELEA